MNVKVSLAKMVEYVQTLLLTIPVNAQENLWEETVNIVSSYYFIYIASIYYGIWAKMDILYIECIPD
jgi:hypothetical protein